MDVRHLNDWNQRRRFLKAYVDEEGDPIGEMEVMLGDGIDEATFRSLVETWDALVGRFQDPIGFR